MSGIVGIINLDGAPVDRDLLRRMTDFMSYRGPDAQEVWIDGHVGFGHTMLRTTWEAETETQPLTLDGKVWPPPAIRIVGENSVRYWTSLTPVSMLGSYINLSACPHLCGGQN